MLDLLREAEAFQGFPRDSLLLLAEQGTRRSFRAGSLLARQGEPADTMHVIMRGCVRVERTHPSLPTPLMLAELGRGGIVGEMGILDSKPRSATVIAIEDTVTMELSADALFETLRRAPDASGALLRLMAGRLRSTDELIEAVVQRLHWQAEILDLVEDGICRLDREGRIVFVNPATVRMVGYGPGELLGQSLHSLIHHSKPDGAPYLLEECPICAALKDGDVHRGAGEVHWRKDGSRFPVEYVSTPIREDGRLVGAVVAFRDMTQRRGADQIKDRFVSIVSHELRTPLTSIRGSLGLVESGQLGALPERAQRMVEIAVANSDRLVRLINDLLDMERIESGKAILEKRAYKAANLLTQAAEAIHPMAEKAGVTLSVGPQEARVWADADRILQTLTNLLGNAIKFSPAGGTVLLTAQRQGDEVLFQVKDQGRGIPADRLEAIFQPFQQIQVSDAREKGGTGLGLPICRSIVHQHGGRIWAESTLGQGSTFSFTLPALPAEEESDVPTAVATGPAVLVCDDDPWILELARTILGQQGYRPIVVSSWQEAVDEAEIHKPAVILLDLMMPGTSAWEITAALKERASTKDIPIITFNVLTPEASLATAETASPSGEGPGPMARFEAIASGLKRHAWTGRILVVEDDLDLARVIAATFERHGIETVHARTGRQAIRLAQRVLPNLLVLDLVLPDGDGYVVVDWLRQHELLGALALIVYTAKELDDSERARLRLGQTLFLTKGRVSPQEFEERVVGLLDRIIPGRSNNPEHAGQTHLGD